MMPMAVRRWSKRLAGALTVLIVAAAALTLWAQPVFAALLAVTMTALIVGPAAGAERYADEIVARHIQTIVPSDGAGGVAVALRMAGRTSFFNYGWADRAAQRPITADTLFNLASLRKVFETTLLAHAVRNGEMSLKDPAAKYVTELQAGGDIRRVTLGQLGATLRGCCCRRTTLPGRIGVTRCPSSSARSMAGRRIRSPVGSICTPMQALSCCSWR